MNMTNEERDSDSPYIEKIGRFRAEYAYSRTCPANVLSNFLIVTYQGRTSFSVWGPEIQPGLMTFPTGAEFLYIQLKLGCFMPRLPARDLVNTGTILPDAASQSFWLDSSAWQYPTYENADTFVDWLVKEELLVYEPVVDAVLQNTPQDMPSRTVRHRFLRATGLTRSHIDQIQRAQHAAALLEQGLPILDVVEQAGYADQPHLTRSLKRFIGQTPAQVVRASSPDQASIDMMRNASF
jgi:AraC-like DNA-binding protein